MSRQGYDLRCRIRSSLNRADDNGHVPLTQSPRSRLDVANSVHRHRSDNELGFVSHAVSQVGVKCESSCRSSCRSSPLLISESSVQNWNARDNGGTLPDPVLAPELLRK